MKVDSIDITLIISLFVYAGASAWYIWRYKKEKNPQDYIRRNILTIELWIIAIFLMTVMRKTTILIAW